MTVFEKLVIKIKEDLNTDVENMHRTYVGHQQKTSGAFVWRCNIVGLNYEYGSGISASELLRSEKLTLQKGWGFGESEVMG